MATDLKITLIKSVIGSPKKIRATAVGLGLIKTNKSVMRKDTPEIRGMIHKIQHLVKVEEI